jgi:hypothetical protein
MVERRVRALMSRDAAQAVEALRIQSLAALRDNQQHVSVSQHHLSRTANERR